MTRLKGKITVVLTFFSLLILAGCSPLAAEASDLSSRQIRVVATTGMITDMVQRVGGERVQVIGLMGPGVDPHLFKASEGDVLDIAEADVIFYNGLHLEAGMSKVLDRMAELGKAVPVTKSIDPSRLKAPPEFQGAYDPHIWFDVDMWLDTVPVIRDTFIQLDPASADLYTRNADAVLEELKQLHGYVQEQAERVPAEKRVLITAHDAFNYFGAAYGFDVRGLQGISTQTEASTADVKELAEFIVERQIPAIFVESSVPQRTVEAVQAAVRARGFDVQIGGSLYSDAMGDPGTPEGTYPGMVRHNIDTIVSALLGEN